MGHNCFQVPMANLLNHAGILEKGKRAVMAGDLWRSCLPHSALAALSFPERCLVFVTDVQFSFIKFQKNSIPETLSTLCREG